MTATHKRFKTAAAVAAAIAFTGTLTTPTAATAAGDQYPTALRNLPNVPGDQYTFYKDHDGNGQYSGDGSLEWANPATGFAYRNCTDAVAYMLRNNNGIPDFTNWWGGQGTWGNATQWKKSADNKGILSDQSPAVGSVAQWDAYHGGMSWAGHVAWVSEVRDGGNTIVIEEYNVTPGTHGTRTLTRNGAGWPSNFIHIADLDGPINAGPTAHVWDVNSTDYPIIVDGDTVHAALPNGSTRTMTFGTGTEQYFFGKWTANATRDSVATIASNGRVNLATSLWNKAHASSFMFGPGLTTGAKYLIGDFDGDTIDEIGFIKAGDNRLIYRAGLGHSAADKTVIVIDLGAPIMANDQLLVGRWDNQDVDRVIYARPNLGPQNRQWGFLAPAFGTMPAMAHRFYGNSNGTTPLTGDFDGHLDSDAGIYLTNYSIFRFAYVPGNQPSPAP